jgi:hypothetical protein
VFKNNPINRISESFNVQFRAELFNILNRANFAVPVTPGNVIIFDSTGELVAGAGFRATHRNLVEMADAISFKKAWKRQWDYNPQMASAEHGSHQPVRAAMNVRGYPASDQEQW